MGTEIERAFKLFDVEKKGMITLSSLRRVAQEVGEKLSEDELHEMILLADRAKAPPPTLLPSRPRACALEDWLTSMIWTGRGSAV
jgi:hypothetical protein